MSHNSMTGEHSVSRDSLTDEHSVFRVLMFCDPRTGEHSEWPVSEIREQLPVPSPCVTPTGTSAVTTPVVAPASWWTRCVQSCGIIQPLPPQVDNGSSLE